MKVSQSWVLISMLQIKKLVVDEIPKSLCQQKATARLSSDLYCCFQRLKEPLNVISDNLQVGINFWKLTQTSWLQKLH